MISIDVIIPSYRLQAKYLEAIVKMDIPADTRVRFLIIADNPEVQIPENLLPSIDNDKVILIRNKENLGASQTRNRGIDRSNAGWILFLDDDVIPDKNLLAVYKNAIEAHPEEMGFFGKTVFPKPVNSFTKGLIVSDMLHFFEMAKYGVNSKAATTSNVMVNRAAVGDIRFSTAFPKKGGGEDFAFFLEIHQKTGKSLKSVPEAVVYHNWWHDGKRNYNQFFRWCYAEYELFRRFPRVTYYDFPNLPEMLLIAIPAGAVVSVAMASWLPVILILGGICTGELAGRFLFLLWAKGLKSSFYVAEVTLVRALTDLGRVYGLLVNAQPEGLLKRASYSVEKRNIHYFLLSGFKFFCYLTGMGGLLFLVYAV